MRNKPRLGGHLVEQFLRVRLRYAAQFRQKRQGRRVDSRDKPGCRRPDQPSRWLFTRPEGASDTGRMHRRGRIWRGVVVAAVVFSALWVLGRSAVAVTGGELLDRMDKISSIAGAVAAIVGIAAGLEPNTPRRDGAEQREPPPAAGHMGKHRRSRLETCGSSGSGHATKASLP